MTRRGFSLLEVMVALSILSIAVVALFQLFSLNLRSVKKAEDYSKALIYARSIMDEAYALPKMPETSESFVFEGFRGDRSVSLKSSDEKTNTYLYEITVTVSWHPSGFLKIKGLKAYHEPEK